MKGLLSLGCVFLIGTVSARADEAGLRKEALKLNDLVGDTVIAERLDALKKDPAHAKQLLAAAVAAAKDKPESFNYTAAHVLAQVAREVKDLAAADRFYRICIDRAAKLESERKRLAAYVDLLHLLFENKKDDDAGKLVKDFVRANSESDELEITLFEERDLLDRLDSFKKDNDRAKKLVGVAAAEAKDKDAALNYSAAFLLAALARQAKDIDSGKLLLRWCADKSKKVRDKAERMYNDARTRDEKLEAADKLTDAERDLALVTLEFVDLLTEHKKYDEAEKLCKDFLDIRGGTALNQGKVLALRRMVQVTALQGKTEQAFKQLEPFLKAAPDDPAVLDMHGWLLRHTGKYEEAVKVYEQAFEKTRNDDLKDRMRYILSGVYVEVGNIDKSAEHLRELLKKQPENPTYNNDLGYILADHDRELEEAEKMIRKAVQKEPDNPAYLDSLGWVLYKQKKYKEAKPPLLEAIQLPDGQHPELYDHLGDIHKALGEKADAVAAWKKALELSGPSKRDAKRKTEIEKKIKESQ